MQSEDRKQAYSKAIALADQANNFLADIEAIDDYERDEFLGDLWDAAFDLSINIQRACRSERNAEREVMKNETKE